jgi:hypothetical protein
MPAGMNKDVLFFYVTRRFIPCDRIAELILSECAMKFNTTPGIPRQPGLGQTFIRVVIMMVMR